MSAPDNATPPAPSFAADPVTSPDSTIAGSEERNGCPTHNRHSIAAIFKRRAIEAARAIHGKAPIVTEFGEWCMDFREYIGAALAAVEAVRAFSTRPAICPWGQCVSDSRPCVMCDIYGDGVEAVQALLEGIK